MSFLLEIVIDYFGWILGIKSEDELSKGNNCKAFFLLSIFTAIIATMGIYSLIWIIVFIKT